MSIHPIRRFNDSLRDGGITDAEIRKGYAVLLWLLIIVVGAVVWILSLTGVT